MKDHRIFEFIVRTAWLHFHDAMEAKPPKIKLFAGTYRKGKNKADSMAHHYVDVHKFRPYLADMSWGKPVNFIDFKGSPGKDGKPAVSRTLSVNTDDDGNVWWKLTHGRGKETPTGAITPAYKNNGGPDLVITVKMSKDEARQMAFQVLEYLQAWTTAQLVAQAQPTSGEPLSFKDLNKDWFNATPITPIKEPDDHQPTPPHKNGTVLKETPSHVYLYH